MKLVLECVSLAVLVARYDGVRYLELVHVEKHATLSF